MEKKLVVAFLYNVRHKYPDTNDPKTHLEVDFDDPPAIEKMIEHLIACGYEVIPIEANEKAYLELYQNKDKIDIAFNFSEGIYGNDREAQIPAMLEMLQIPYTGSTPLTEAIILNKVKTKEILNAHNIPTAPFQVLDGDKDVLRKDLEFPLIVKPISEGSSAGITNDSVVFNNEQLFKQVDFIKKTFKQAALVEKFLEGREFSIPMLGNPPQILPIIGPDHSQLPKKYLPIDSFEVKWFYEDEAEVNHLMCPAKIEKKLEDEIKDICFKTWDALNIRDLCRIDVRCDKEGKPYVLEVNAPPGMIPPEISESSYFPMAARVAGMDHQTMIKTIINAAMRRYENK